MTAMPKLENDMQIVAVMSDAFKRLNMSSNSILGTDMSEYGVETGNTAQNAANI